MAKTTPSPKAEIKRSDIFAETNRIKARERHHLSEGTASAYGLAVAKIVAAQKFYGYKPEQVSDLCAYVCITEAPAPIVL